MSVMTEQCDDEMTSGGPRAPLQVPEAASVSEVPGPSPSAAAPTPTGDQHKIDCSLYFDIGMKIYTVGILYNVLSYCLFNRTKEEEASSPAGGDTGGAAAPRAHEEPAPTCTPAGVLWD